MRHFDQQLFNIFQNILHDPQDFQLALKYRLLHHVYLLLSISGYVSLTTDTYNQLCATFRE